MSFLPCPPLRQLSQFRQFPHPLIRALLVNIGREHQDALLSVGGLDSMASFSYSVNRSRCHLTHDVINSLILRIAATLGSKYNNLLYLKTSPHYSYPPHYSTLITTESLHHTIIHKVTGMWLLAN